MHIKHYIDSHIDVKTASTAVIIFIIMSFLFMALENHIFWIEVTKVRILTGADSSLK